MQIDQQGCKAEEVSIGNDVWIGTNATILAGVTVGDGAIIGAHALVNKNVEPYSIVVGTPARHVRYRFDEDVISKLKAQKWWEWSDAKIKEHTHLFDDPAVAHIIGIDVSPPTGPSAKYDYGSELGGTTALRRQLGRGSRKHPLLTNTVMTAM